MTGGTKKQRELSASIARFTARQLMSKRLMKNIYVEIKLIPRLLEKEEVYGDSIYEDDNWRPREFTIQADSKLKLRRLLETIAHEMVHVKQFAKGEMVDVVRANKIRWHGVDFDDEDKSYYDQPWEIEAHGREMGLFKSLGTKVWLCPNRNGPNTKTIDKPKEGLK